MVINHVKEVSIRCDDQNENLVFCRYDFGDNDYWYEVGIEDSYCGNDGHTGIFGRLKRAWCAFWAKPIYHNEIVVSDGKRIEKFLMDCLNVVQACYDE